MFPGGKNGSGVYQRIINQIPPHEVYIEAFAGSAAVWRYKRLAARSVLIDVDASTIARLNDAGLSAGTIAVRGDAVRWLAVHKVHPGTMIYCDPPYLPSTRSKKNIYRHEMTHVDHERMLELLTSLNAMVAISGYDSKLYRCVLDGWRRIEYDTMTRGGQRREILWMNYDEPQELHDYRYIGENFRERERFRRQQERWGRRLASMDRLQRLALLSSIVEIDDSRGNRRI
jgi:16S rRNA G966 N2-methylase RsmD